MTKRKTLLYFTAELLLLGGLIVGFPGMPGLLSWQKGDLCTDPRGVLPRSLAPGRTRPRRSLKGRSLPGNMRDSIG